MADSPSPGCPNARESATANAATVGVRHDYGNCHAPTTADPEVTWTVPGPLATWLSLVWLRTMVIVAAQFGGVGRRGSPKS